MAKIAIPGAQRGTVFLIPPEQLTLITDPAHELFDARVLLPVDEGLVLSMMAVGFKSTMRGFKDGDKAVILDGHRRTAAALEANRRLRAEGRPEIICSVMLERGDTATLFALQSLANENRVDASDLERAQILVRIMAFGRSEAEAGATLGFTTRRTQDLLKLLDCAPVVQKAVEAGKISTSAAVRYSKLDRDGQARELAAALEKSGGKRVPVREVTKAVKKATAKPGSAPAVEPPTRKEIARVLGSLKGCTMLVDPSAVLGWVLLGTATGRFAELLAASTATAPSAAPAA